MLDRFQLSRRAILWLGVIAITAFMLYLKDARYDNIDKHGIDYHLIETKKNCRLNQSCILRKYAEGINLTVQFTKQKPGRGLIMTIERAPAITRALLRIAPQHVKNGVVSAEVKGRSLHKLDVNRWQLKNILVKKRETHIKYILYVFTSRAIYEIRQTISLSR